MIASRKNVLIEKRWALTAIVLGFLLGFISAFICVKWNLVIFGFNIMYIISPLIAGFVEIFIARRKYGKNRCYQRSFNIYFNQSLWLGWPWLDYSETRTSYTEFYYFNCLNIDCPSCIPYSD